MKLGAGRGFCQRSVPGPMMGNTPWGVVAWRMWPSRVDRLRVVDPRPGEPQPVQSDTTVFIALVWGGAQEPQSGFLDGAGGRGGGGVVVDVPVIMLLESQQSKLYEKLEVPQIQLIRPSRSRCSSWRLSTCPLLCNDRRAQLQCVDKVVYIPVVTQRLIPMVPSVLKTIEISQLQFIDKVVDFPVWQVVRVQQVPSWRRQLCSHSCSSLKKSPRSVDKVVDMLVGVQRQVLGFRVQKTAVAVH